MGLINIKLICLLKPKWRRVSVYIRDASHWARKCRAALFIQGANEQSYFHQLKYVVK